MEFQWILMRFGESSMDFDKNLLDFNDFDKISMYFDEELMRFQQILMRVDTISMDFDEI